MNIQIFGIGKCFETKKAQRYFKERAITYKYIDLKEKGLSKGEFNSVKQSLGSIDEMINPMCKDKELVVLLQHMSGEQKEDKIFENQHILITPIVRNGKQATVGYVPKVWKQWN